MPTLRTLLNASKLSNWTVLGGEQGLDKDIRVVTVLDAPDAPQWLKGKEFVMTSAYIFLDDPSRLSKFVMDLIDVGATGLGIKIGRYMDNLTADVVEIANQYNFPIVAIPYKLVWSDVFAVFYELRYEFESDKNLAKIDSMAIGQLLEARKRGSKELLRKLTELFNISAVIINEKRDIIAVSDLQGSQRINKLLMDNLDFPLNDSSKYPMDFESTWITVKPIRLSKGRPNEYIIIEAAQKKFSKDITEILEMITNVLSNDILLEKGKTQIFQKYLLNIVKGNITTEEIRNFALDHDQGPGFVYCVILLGGARQDEIYQQLCELSRNKRAKKLDSYAIYLQEEQEMVILLSICDTAPSQPTLTAWLREVIRGVDPALLEEPDGLITVGNMYQTIEKVRDSYLEAREAKRIGSLLWPGLHLHFYNDLSIYSLVKNVNLSDRVFSDILLLEHSKKKLSFDGLNTLEAYFESANYKKAAEKLFIHENTMRYRIQKIGELLGLDLDDPFIQQNLIIKIKLWKLKNCK